MGSIVAQNGIYRHGNHRRGRIGERHIRGGEFDDLLIGTLVAMLVYIPGELASLAAILVIYLSAAKQGY